MRPRRTIRSSIPTERLNRPSWSSSNSLSPTRG
jgi:hypothetical protein